MTTSREQLVLRRMILEKWQRGTTIPKAASFSLDEYSGIGILTFSPPDTAEPNQLEQEIVRAAFGAAVSAMRADDAVSQLVVRCVASIPDDQGQGREVVLFRARAVRAALTYWLGKDTAPSFGQIKNSILSEISWDKEAVGRHRDRLERQAEGK